MIANAMPARANHSNMRRLPKLAREIGTERFRAFAVDDVVALAAGHLRPLLMISARPMSAARCCSSV